MRRFVEEADRGQWNLLPQCLDASDVSTPLSSVLQSFSVNFGPIYFMGERHNSPAPDVTRR
jgi:hypothetical protein